MIHRAETYDTMLAWYDDIKNLIDKTGAERNAFVRRHARSVSAGSARSVSSDGALEEDEADEVPFSANQSMTNEAPKENSGPPERPSPGGRFPSDVQISRNLQAASSSRSSSEVGHDITTASGGLQGAYPPYPTDSKAYQQVQQPQQSQAAYANHDAYGYNAENAYQSPPPALAPMQTQTSYYANNNPPANPVKNNCEPAPNPYQAPIQAQAYEPQQYVQRHDSTYGDWMAPAVGGAAAGALGAEAYHQYEQGQQQQQPVLVNDFAQDHLTPEAVPERHPEHTAAPVAVPVSAPAPIMVEPDSLATTPATTDKSFLDEPEAVPVAASSRVANGGTVSSDTSKGFPRMTRNNTDISVSDLHVPGEYPRVNGA